MTDSVAALARLLWEAFAVRTMGDDRACWENVSPERRAEWMKEAEWLAARGVGVRPSEPSEAAIRAARDDSDGPVELEEKRYHACPEGPWRIVHNGQQGRNAGWLVLGESETIFLRTERTAAIVRDALNRVDAAPRQEEQP